MKVDHKANFFFAYAYIKPEGDKGLRALNIIKALTYIPLIGAVEQVFFMISIGKPHLNELGEYAALSSRLIVSLICPFVLPLIDTIATIWFAVDQRKNG